MTNREVAQKLRHVAVAYEILGENRFRINAYTQAADSIENLAEDIEHVWKRGDIQKIPGIGGTLAQHLEELFTTGSVPHFDDVVGKMPGGMYDLLKVRSIGPKTAFKLAELLGGSEYDQSRTIYERLEAALTGQHIQTLEGFGKKREADILEALNQFKKGTKKKKRMLLVEADIVVENFREHMQKDPHMKEIQFLGSYRRRKDTVGDIDVAVVSDDPSKTLAHFLAYEKRTKTVDQGDQGGTILVNDGVQIDLRVIEKERFGSMLQYFTGSKYHNIRLREYALEKGLSLSEHGIKKVGSDIKEPFATEKSFYNHLGLDYIEPELREDRGEIEAAKQHNLPQLVTPADMRGDLHIHSNYDYPSSHDQGVSPIEDLLKSATEKGYEYIGLADHNPKQSGFSQSDIITITKERREHFENILYEQKLLQKYPRVKKVYMMYEVDIRPDGSLALPDGALDYLDGIIVSLHSSFTQSSDVTTKRILTALGFPKVRIMGHPTGRLVNQRESVSADWHAVFAACKKHDIALEINASPRRLDLPDALAYQAIQHGVRLVIDTDSHQVTQMDHMPYGVSVARRGWAQPHDILNTKPFTEFDKWFMKGR